MAAAALAYRLQSQALLLAVIAITMTGAVAMHLLERTWLRDWPRYALGDGGRKRQAPE